MRHSAILTLQMSRGRALELDLLVCKNCGWRPNNHFQFEPRKCAHDDKCPGYEETTRSGISLVKEKP